MYKIETAGKFSTHLIFFTYIREKKSPSLAIMNKLMISAKNVMFFWSVKILVNNYCIK